MDSDNNEAATTIWKADLQQIVDELEQNHINRALKIQNKKPTPYERKKMASKKGKKLSDISEFSNLIIGNFPKASESEFDTPWKFADAFDKILVKYKTICLMRMENKSLIVKEIDQIRADFVKKFDPFMKSQGYCCGAVWGEKFIDRWCSCINPNPIMFVQKTTNDIFSKIFCDNCVDENNREHCRATHRHDFVELDRFKCIKCQKECHRLCRESFAENTCKTCQPIPFRFNAAPLSESSPSTSAQSSSSSTAPATLIEINTVILKQNNCFTKVLGQKKFKFSKPDLLQKAIEYVKMLRLEQKLGEDEAMNQYYFNLSNCNLKIYGLFHAHEEGDLLMAIAFVEEVGPRCLIEVLAFQATISSIKNVIKKEIITSFFVELVKIQRNLNEFVHIRVAEGVRGYSGEIFENISNQLPKINIAVKKLKDSLVNTSSLFQIPCFSNDPKFLQIINVIHELGFKINGKLPKLRSHLSLEAAAKNYIAQLTNEIVVNGLTKKMIAKSDSAKENGSEEKSLSILSINDLLQAMEEMHLKFSDIQNCCYSTFKIVGLFFDPRSESLLPKAKSVDSGYSSLNSPSSASGNYGFSAAVEEKEKNRVEKRICPSPISSSSSSSLSDSKKRKIENEKPHLTVSKIVTSIYTARFEQQDRKENGSPNLSKTISSINSPHSSSSSSSPSSGKEENLNKGISPSSPTIFWDVSPIHVKEEENGFGNICINLPSITSISSKVFLPTFDDELNKDRSLSSIASSSTTIYKNSNDDSPIKWSFSNFMKPDDESKIPDSCSIFDKENNLEFCNSPSPTVLSSNDSMTASKSNKSKEIIRSSTPGPDILNLLPSLTSTLTILSPDEEIEKEENQTPLSEEHLKLCYFALKHLEAQKSAKYFLNKNYTTSKIDIPSALNIITTFCNENYSN